jgi:hypothetical protein
MNKFNRQILALHRTYATKINEELAKVHPSDKDAYNPDLLPMFYDDFDISKNEILISGINPSFSKLHHGGLDQNIFSTRRFNQLPSHTKQSEEIDELIRIQKCLKFGGADCKTLKQIDYFNKVEHFASNVSYPNAWDHYDIFPHRHTNQKYFLKAVYKVDGYKQAALEIFKSLLESKRYKVVCIFNGGSCDLLLNKKTKFFDLKPLGVSPFKNRKYGFYEAKIGEHKQKFFLYKVISGQGQPGPDERDEMFEKFCEYL